MFLLELRQRLRQRLRQIVGAIQRFCLSFYIVLGWKSRGVFAFFRLLFYDGTVLGARSAEPRRKKFWLAEPHRLALAGKNFLGL
jgi:hypothetical protein